MSTTYLCYIRVWHNTVHETQLHNAILWKNSHQANTPHKGLHDNTASESRITALNITVHEKVQLFNADE